MSDTSFGPYSIIVCLSQYLELSPTTPTPAPTPPQRSCRNPSQSSKPPLGLSILYTGNFHDEQGLNKTYDYKCTTGPHGPIGEWDVSSVTDMMIVFEDEKSFHGDISKWDVSGVKRMRGIFHDAKIFNGDISKWDVSSVVDMWSMFWDAESFNGDISKWDVSSVKDMHEMFMGATSFNGDISKWDVSSLNDMHGMFYRAKAFNSDISKWELSRVKGVYSMFRDATSFNSGMSNWDLSRVTNMMGMFYNAQSFNGDISKWDVSRVKDMHSMFAKAEAFNNDISKWDVSSVTSMGYMFWHATLFNQKLCGAAWVHSVANKDFMFQGSSGSISDTVCTSAPKLQYVSRRPITERVLMVRTPITKSVSTPPITSCPKCGMFAKSGRLSCCAPGGAWFKNCGGFSNSNVDHRWSEGVEACKRTFRANGL